VSVLSEDTIKAFEWVLFILAEEIFENAQNVHF
jgi:hypothetical protein